MKKVSSQERGQMIQEMQSLAPKGTQFYTIVRAKSSSGSEIITFFVIKPAFMDGRYSTTDVTLTCSTDLIAALAGYTCKQTSSGEEGICINGSGFSHVDECLRRLGQEVWNDTTAYTCEQL